MRVLVIISSTTAKIEDINNNNNGSNIINNNSNNKVFLEVHPNQSIWMIKTQLFNLFSVPPARQQLYLKVIDENHPKEVSKAYSKLLHSYRLVKDYNINEGSELQMVMLDKEIPSEFLIPPKKDKTLPNKLSMSTMSADDLSLMMSQNGNQGGGRIHVLSSKRGEECPALCFGIGKGLYRGISGVVYEIKLYRVDSKGVLIQSTSLNFVIDIIKKDSISVEDRKMPFTYEQRKSEYSLLKLEPTIYGEYSISIKIDGAPICGSPFHCTIIDELNPNLKELAFSNEWIEEVVQLITLMSNKASTIDKLFSFGIEGLVNLMFYPDSTIQIHIIGIFAKLIEKDKNKERVIKEFGMDFIFKLVSLDNWSNFMELRKLVASSLCILSCYKPFISRFLKEVGADIIKLIAHSEFIDCPRSCSIFLSRVSEIYEVNDYLISDSIKETLIYLLSIPDNITINCTLKTISNLSSSFDLKKESNIKLLSSLLSYCKEFQDVSKRVLIFKSFSNFCVNESLCTYLIANGILDLITPTHDNSGYFGMPMFCQWESNTVNYLLSSNTESNTISYSSSFSQIFKEETDYVFFLSLTISNMLVSTTSLKIHDHFSRGNGLNLLKQFIICHECSARSEAFRSFMIISNSPNDQCKKHLITSGIIPYLVSSLYDSLSVETPFIVNTLSNLCRYDPDCVENMGVDDIDKFIELLHANSDSLSHSLCYILSHILIKQDKYKTRIVVGGGKLFLQHLIEFARQGEVQVLKYISQADLELTKEIGRGVSGVVKRGKWKGFEIAVKQFTEDNLSFTEREFHSEATIMSVLRHDNIVHCIGGSSQPGKMYLVCDFYSRGSLFSVISANICPLSNARIVHIALQVAKGMCHLHSLGIIHRDLKSGNLLIDQEWNVRISDFGISRVIDNRMTKTLGTPCYMAPEMLQGLTEYTQQVDVYSFAFVLWECLSRQIPYVEYTDIQWITMVLEDSFRPPIPDQCLPEFKDLIQQCWSTNPSDRPTFEEIVIYLENLRIKMQEQGIYEGFTLDLSSVGNSKSSGRSDSTVGNENNINLDLSMHPSEELKNLVEFDQSSLSTRNSVSSDSSSSISSTPQSPIGSISPIGSTSTSPTALNLNNPSAQKWERIVPDRPASQGNSKRLSAFRNNRQSSPPLQSSPPSPPNNIQHQQQYITSTDNDSSSATVPISISDNNNHHHNNSDNNHNVSKSNNSNTFTSSSILLSSTVASSGIESNKEDSFLSDISSLSVTDQQHSNKYSHGNSIGGFSLPPPPLHPSYYASLTERISPDNIVNISSSIEDNNNKNNNINNTNNSNNTNTNNNNNYIKFHQPKFKQSPSFEALKSKFDNIN